MGAAPRAGNVYRARDLLAGKNFSAGRVIFTDREKEVLELLYGTLEQRDWGRSRIEERTVKAHVAKLMRKVGVQNRIALSVHAIYPFAGHVQQVAARISQCHERNYPGTRPLRRSLCGRL